MKIKRISVNKFAAYDDIGICRGQCVIRRRDLSRVYPDRPIQYEIVVSCDEDSRDLLWSAALTRARVVAAEEPLPSRVFTVLSPNDGETGELLTALGMKTDDGIVRYKKRVTGEKIYLPVPEGCAIRRDFLGKEDEMRKCLTRYNETFAREEKRDWLEEIASRPDFARILMVSPEELCGEALLWRSGSTGIIGVLQTVPKWRRQGVASYLMEDARKYFESIGVTNMAVDVRLSAPGNRALARKSGFSAGDTLTVYPYIDVK